MWCTSWIWWGYTDIMKAPPLLAWRGMLGVKHSRYTVEEEGRRMEYMAFDSHTHDTLARVEDGDGRKTREARIAHERGALQRFLAAGESGSPVAVETIGNW